MKTLPTDSKTDVRAWLTPLRRIESIAQSLRAAHPLSPDRRETLEIELSDIEARLPVSIADPLRGRSSSGRRLVALARNHQCEACHTRVPRGDQGGLLLGRPVFCQFCGVLLHLDESACVQSTVATEAKLTMA